MVGSSFFFRSTSVKTLILSAPTLAILPRKNGEFLILALMSANSLPACSFDVATFLAFGAAHMALAGSDVLMEFNYSEIYTPLDLGIGKCRLAVAEKKDLAQTEDPQRWRHLRIATKYPEVTKRHFARRGVQAECIKLNGALELAPQLGLCRRIVDLVASGRTLRENGLVEVEHIADVTTRFALNRSAFKTRSAQIRHWLGRFRAAAGIDARAA